MNLILEFNEWDKQNPKPKFKKIDESLFSKFFGDDTADLGRMCEEIRTQLSQIPSQAQDHLMTQLEIKFGRVLVNAIDGGWTSAEFEKHSTLPSIQDLQKRSGLIRQWIDENIS